jgi:hypothetical protein
MASASAPQAIVMKAEAGGMDRPHSSHDCEGACAGGVCCASVSSLTDQPDLRLPDRGAPTDLTRLRVIADVSVPAPDRGNSAWGRDTDVDLFSAVRLHVWTATFLS